MFAEIDLDNDGLITYKDFIDCLYDETTTEDNKVVGVTLEDKLNFNDDGFLNNFPKDSKYSKLFNVQETNTYL